MLLPKGQYEFWWLMTTESFPAPKLYRVLDNFGYYTIRGYFAFSEIQEKEHRVIMEEWLCRKLRRSEEIHHVNKIKTDNRLENLLLCSRKEHLAFHPRKKGWHPFEETRAKMSAHHKSKNGSWRIGNQDELKERRKKTMGK